MVNSPLIRPYLLGGVALGGVPLGSHDYSIGFRWGIPEKNCHRLESMVFCVQLDVPDRKLVDKSLG